MVWSYITFSIKSAFDKLSDSLKEKLSDAKKFVQATVSELLSVPQDVLSSLQVHLLLGNILL